MAARKITTGRAKASSVEAKAVVAKAKASPKEDVKVEAKASGLNLPDAGPVVLFKHWSVSPYTGLKSPFLGGLTAAALIVAGYATIKGNVMTKTKTAGRPAVLKALAGDFAGEWKRLGRIEGATLTVDGINALNARLAGVAKTYNTKAEVVAALVTAMTKGGKVSADGHPPVIFASKVTV